MQGKRINIPKLLVLEGFSPNLEAARQLIASGRVAFDGTIFRGVYLLMEILQEKPQ